MTNNSVEALRLLAKCGSMDLSMLGSIADEMEALQCRLKRHEPVSRYNGHDIEWWKAEAERLQRMLWPHGITDEPNSKRGSPPFPEVEAAVGGSNSPDVRSAHEPSVSKDEPEQCSNYPDCEICGPDAKPSGEPRLSIPTRYQMVLGTEVAAPYERVPCEVEHPTGEWVKFSDIEHLLGQKSG